MKYLSALFLIAFGCLVSITHATELKSIDAFQTTSSSVWKHNGIEITLFGPDNPNKPVIWEGPLEIKSKNRTTRYDIELIYRLHIMDKTLFVLSSSGSKYYLDMIDIISHAHLVNSKTINSGTVEFKNQLISIKPLCECSENNTCLCNPGQVFKWDNTGIFYDKEKSMALTRKMLGSSFEGAKQIPRSLIQTNK